MRIKEPLSGGLVTSRDPASLNPGELSETINCAYRTGSQALRMATGRQVFWTVSAASVAVAGLRDLTFDNGNQYLVADCNNSRRYAILTGAETTVGVTGTLETLTTGSTLEAVHYRNRFFLFNGVSANVTAIGTNSVVYLSATATAATPSVHNHGLLAVDAAPNAVTASGTFSQTVTGYYEYWTTEVQRLQIDGVKQTRESAFDARNGVTTVYITATGQVPTIQQPHIKNDETTHWRIYRSPKKEASSDKMFPSGFLISSDISTAQASFADTSVPSSTSFVFPSTFGSGTNFFSDASAQASALVADDASYCNFTGPAGPGYSAPQRQGTYGYSFGGFGGSVRGIEVVTEAYISSGAGPVNFTVTIGPDRDSTGAYPGQSVGRRGEINFGPNTASKSALVTATASGSPQTITFGGTSDRWVAADNPGFADTDFDSNFQIVLTMQGTSQVLRVDYVKARVHYNAAVDSTIPFPTVVFQVGDQTTEVAKNHPPPSSSTGDLFQDQLVVNDVLNPSLIRYSVAGDTEAFPLVYYLDFETRENDQVRLIKTLNNRLIVGLDGSLWRVNYLPSERDASFDRGKALEPISESYGVLGPMLATTYSPDGVTQRLAFASHYGIHDTDGYSFRTLSQNVDWRTLVPATTGGAPIALIDDPQRQELILYFFTNLVTERFALHFNYGPTHLLPDGLPKAAGPVHMENQTDPGVAAVLSSAWRVRRKNGNISIFLGYNGTGGAAASAQGAGQVWIETGTTIPSLTPTMSYTTRRLYPFGEGGEGHLNRIYNYASVVASANVETYQPLISRTNPSAAEANGGSYSVTRTVAGLYRNETNDRIEGVRIRFTQGAAADHAADFLILEASDLQKEDL